MGRLAGLTTAEVQKSRRLVAFRFAREYRAVVVLKGHGTVVSDGRRVFVNPTGNPGMATGGTGDVLTGVIAALLGQGLSPFDAAVLGAYVHGLAGDLAAKKFGQVSLIATDLLDCLPQAFQTLAAGKKAPDLIRTQQSAADKALDNRDLDCGGQNTTSSGRPSYGRQPFAKFRFRRDGSAKRNKRMSPHHVKKTSINRCFGRCGMSVVILFCIVLSGCGTLITLTDLDNEGTRFGLTFGGVRFDCRGAFDDDYMQHFPIGVPLCIIDLPLSLAGDAIVLPGTLTIDYLRGRRCDERLLGTWKADEDLTEFQYAWYHYGRLGNDFSIVTEQHDKQAGIYFLRTSLKGNDEKTLWSIYNIIREIEYTFRVLKTDLDLRPIYHKTDSAAMAHLHLGMLAYWLVATIRYQLKQQGINSDWREIVRTMNTQKCVTTSLVNIKNETISIRQCTEPTKEVKKIYDLLKYKYAPFVRKKSVVPPAEIFKNDSP